MPTYYAILGLDPRKFDPVHLKKQYRALALRWHPDRNRGNEEAAAEKFKELQKAFEVLSDEALRRSYDRELMVRRARGFDSVTPRGKATPRSQPPPPPPPPPKDEQSRKIVNDALRSDEWLHEVNRRAKLAADKQEEEEIDEALKAVEEAIQREQEEEESALHAVAAFETSFEVSPDGDAPQLSERGPVADEHGRGLGREPVFGNLSPEQQLATLMDLGFHAELAESVCDGESTIEELVDRLMAFDGLLLTERSSAAD